MDRFCTSLMAALVLAGISPAFAAGEFTHEGWSGRVALKDGKFVQCQIWTSAINNYDVGFSLDAAGDMKLGLRSHKIDMTWEMIFGQKAALRIQLDQGPVLTKVFTAVTPTLLTTPLKGTDWDKRLANGKLLRINTGTRVRLFHLTGIGVALGKLRACTAKHKA